MKLKIEVMELEKFNDYNGQKSWQFERVAKAISESNGVVAISNVHIAGMQSVMQNFFDHLMEWEENSEAFYRIMRQRRSCIMSSERYK